MAASTARKLLMLRAVARDEPLSSIQAARYTHIVQTVCGHVLKELYDTGMLWRVYEKRLRFVFHQRAMRRTLCYKLTDEGRRTIERADHDSRISHEGGSKEGQSAGLRQTSDTGRDDRADGIAGGDGNEPAGQVPEHAADGT